MAVRPNILLLMTDQQRFDALGYAGNSVIQTPQMDALAASGVYFRQACTSTPVCVAARMSLITGQRSSRTHWVDNGQLSGPTPELPTLMTLLHEAGYRTHAVGKMHFGGRHYGLQGHESCEEVIDAWIEDDYIGYLRAQGVRTRHPHGLRDLLYYQPQTSGIAQEYHRTPWVTRRSIDFLRQHMRYNAQRPFFLWTSWISPHPPFAPPAPYDSRYDPAAMPRPVYPERPLATLPAPAWPHRARLDGARTDPDRLQRIRALYYGLVSQVDDGVGEILHELERLGLAENTVVIFLSDHGDMLGDHGLSQKNVPYEPSVRVPLMVRWPGRTAAGRVCDDLVGLTDVLPTVVDGAGLAYPTQQYTLPGESLLGSPGGGLATGRSGYLIDYGQGRERWIALRTETHKYALWATGGREELYDLRRDPGETQNLAAAQPEQAAAMRARVLAYERLHGLSDSFAGGEFCTFPEPALPVDEPRQVVINGGRWAANLPADEEKSVESFAQAFTRAIAKEDTLAPEKLSISAYKAQGGDLRDTAWEEAWQRA